MLKVLISNTPSKSHFLSFLSTPTTPNYVFLYDLLTFHLSLSDFLYLHSYSMSGASNKTHPVRPSQQINRYLFQSGFKKTVIIGYTHAYESKTKKNGLNDLLEMKYERICSFLSVRLFEFIYLIVLKWNTVNEYGNLLLSITQWNK